MTRVAAGAAALCALAALAGCGAKTSAPATTTSSPRPGPVVEHRYGKGGDTVWVFRRQNQQPKAVVVFLHGLYDATESTPLNHLDFVRQLASRGDAVVYPRYEKTPGAPGAPLHALKGTVTGLRALGWQHDAPVVVMGYSRGGGLALDLTALLPGVNVIPKAMLSVFPAMMDPPLDYRSIPPTTPMVMFVGDQDTTVSHYGRDQIIKILQANHFPLTHVSTVLIRSTPNWKADHYSFMGSSPAARAAFWTRADRIVDQAIAAQNG